MPNHFHWIIELSNYVVRANSTSAQNIKGKRTDIESAPTVSSLSKIVQTF